jgi:hypothetical protein
MNRPCLRVASLVLLLAWSAPGCHRAASSPSATEAARQTETILTGPITLSVTLSPVPPRLDQLLFLDFHLTHPVSWAVQIHDLTDRLEGFRVLGLYERPAETTDDHRQTTIRLGVQPIPAPRHRIRAMAVSWNPTNDPAAVSWAQTRPLTIALAPLAVPAHPHPPAPPLPVPSDWRTILRSLALAGATLAGACLLILAIYRFRAALRRRRLSPQEQARRALEHLLSQHLVENGQFREFYFELTAIVRRYIEGCTGVRAPEQTTEEFLQIARTDPRFPPAFLTTLDDFLTKADLVKYANLAPAPEGVAAAVAAARTVIETPLSQPSPPTSS